MKPTPDFAPNHPCRQDCPNRTAECKKTCEQWKAYEDKKWAFYRRRVEENELNNAHADAENRRRKEGCFLGSQAKHTRY